MWLGLLWYHVDCSCSDRSLALVPHGYCDDTSVRNHALKSPPTRQPQKRDCSLVLKTAGQKVGGWAGNWVASLVPLKKYHERSIERRFNVRI